MEAKVEAVPRPTEGAHPLIERDPEILSGVPVLAGTRFPVQDVIRQLRFCGGDVNRFQAEYPYISHEQIQAALRYYEEHSGEIEQLLRERRTAYECLRRRKRQSA
jgi:uncharacterized protein (DUF433 family)